MKIRRLLAVLAATALAVPLSLTVAQAVPGDPCDASYTAPMNSTAKLKAYIDCRADRQDAAIKALGTPAPTVTVSVPVPGPTVTATVEVPAPAPTVTVTAPAPTVTVTASTRPTPPAPTASATPTPMPTVTPTPTPTPTVSGALQLNCIGMPSACGYPDATNTGATGTLKRVPEDVKSGTGWTYDSRGWVTAGNAAVLENLILSVSVDVTGANVTVRNNRFTETGETWAVALRHATNATISNNTIGVTGAGRLMVGIKDIYGDSTGTRVVGNNIANTSTGVQIYEGLIEANYIHDMGMISGDHVNGTTSNGGTSLLTIRGNTVLNQFGQTDAISLFQDFGIEANRVITGNLVAGGGYTIYAGDNERYGKTHNIVVTGNRFSNVFFPNGGAYGPYTAAGVGNEWSGNFWDHNGQMVG